MRPVSEGKNQGVTTAADIRWFDGFAKVRQQLQDSGMTSAHARATSRDLMYKAAHATPGSQVISGNIVATVQEDRTVVVSTQPSRRGPSHHFAP